MSSRYESILEAVKQIPKGRVATYGQIAGLAGFEDHARQVGYVLNALPEENDVPWHRVVNARGEISPRTRGDSHELQRLLLEDEGIEFDERGRFALEKYRWERKAGRPGLERRSRGRSDAAREP